MRLIRRKPRPLKVREPHMHYLTTIYFANGCSTTYQTDNKPVVKKDGGWLVLEGDGLRAEFRLETVDWYDTKRKWG